MKFQVPQGTPLMYALSGTWEPKLQEICELLLKHGAKVDEMYSGSEENAIQIAKRIHPSLIRFLEEAIKNQQ